jgi:hypothetical protein
LPWWCSIPYRLSCRCSYGQECITSKSSKEVYFLFLIISGKIYLFDSKPSLEDSAKLVYSIVILTFGFTSLDNAAVFFFLQSKVISLVPVFMPPKDRLAQLHPQALGSIFATFYESRGYRGGILTTNTQAFHSFMKLLLNCCTL